MEVQTASFSTTASLYRHISVPRPVAAPIHFGRFVAIPAARTLLRDGRPVDIGGRAFDLLLVLLRSPGEQVSKAAILRFVWPATIVDESNLRFQMAMLRKVLGDHRDRIKTVTGRGYLFVDDDGACDIDGFGSSTSHSLNVD